MQERYSKEARRPLAEHVADFTRDLQSKGRTVEHVRTTTRHVEVIAEACNAEHIGGLTGAAVQGAIGDIRDTGQIPADLQRSSDVDQGVHTLALERVADTR